MVANKKKTTPFKTKNEMVTTDNSCEPFQLESFIWRQYSSTQMVEMGYRNALMDLLQEIMVLENVHYLSGRRRNNLDGMQSF